MRTLLFLFALLTMSHANASSNTYVGEDEWSRHQRYSDMGVLDVKGIKMGAIKDALGKCSIDGNTLCALKSSEIKNHNQLVWVSDLKTHRKFTKVAAVVQAIDDLPVREGKTYTESETWNFSEKPDGLDTMGVEAESVSSAIFECEKDGNHFCVILNSQIVENNVKYWDSARKMYRRKTTAQTVVKGFKFE